MNYTAKNNKMWLWGEGKQYTGMKISISILVWWNAVYYRLQYCNEHETTVHNVDDHGQYIHIHSRDTTLGDTHIYGSNATPLLASLFTFVQVTE